jgi:hypothetical protein
MDESLSAKLAAILYRQQWRRFQGSGQIQKHMFLSASENFFTRTTFQSLPEYQHR